MSHVEILLSAVTDEFRTYREALSDHLQRPNVTVHVQEDFIASGTDTLEKLDRYIERCDAVVHLAGDMTGAWANAAAVAGLRARRGDLAGRLPALAAALDAGTPLSYTQWEAYLAIYHRKMLLIAVPDAAAPRAPGYRSEAAGQAAQATHLKRLRTLGRYDEIAFTGVDHLATQVLRSAVLDLLAQAAKRELDVDLHDLPYLVDRQPQISRICRLVRDRLESTQGGSAAGSASRLMPPYLFILPARSDDAPDTLARRLAYKDGPEYCRFDGERDAPGWVLEDLVWTVAPADGFADEFAANHGPRIGNALAQASDRSRPVCFSTVVSQSMIEREFKRSIEAWTEFWNALPAQMAGRSSRPLHRLQIVGLLILMLAPAPRRSWLPWGARRPAADRIMAELEAFDRTHASVTVLPEVARPISLPRLGPITHPDAMHWLQLAQVRREKLDRPARAAIQKMFEGGAPVGVSMETFAEKVLEAKRKDDALGRD